MPTFRLRPDLSPYGRFWPDISLGPLQPEEEVERDSLPDDVIRFFDEVEAPKAPKAKADPAPPTADDSKETAQ